MLRRKLIVVAGSDRIARTVTELLRSASRPAQRLEHPWQLGGVPRSTGTLIISDRIQDVTGLTDGLQELCRHRSKRQPPLRVILVHTAAAPPALPDLPADARLRLDTFSLEEQGARVLLARWPLHSGMDPPFGQTIHVLIAGSAPPAQALAVEIMSLLHYGDRLPVLTLASPDPEARREAFLGVYPHAVQFCRLRFTGVEDPELESEPPVTSAYVCMNTPEGGLETAQRLAEHIASRQRCSPLIHLETGDACPRGDIGDWDGQVLPFSHLREACRPEILLDGRGDELARVIHDHYRDSIAAQGRDPAAEPAGRPWEDLATSYRVASRHQADHLWAKLAATDCRAVPEELVESFAFAPLEVERLAVIEHKRWAADRLLDGWTYGPQRDNTRKHHPQLIPYADLSVPMKDLDRFTVRLVPALLARSGRGVVRMLLVGIPDPGRDLAVDRTLRRLVERALERLVLRYPDRSLVLASTLEAPAARLVVRRALDQFDAGLFLLCPRPLPDTLGAQPDRRARRGLLQLAARAERRITLAGADTPDKWIGKRAEIILLLGAGATAERPRKRVRIDPRGMGLDWGFEY